MTYWVDLGAEAMRHARRTLGLSYEAVGRLLDVSSKTYERWEKRGQVPNHMLQKVAGTLALEVEMAPPHDPIRVNDPDVAAGHAKVLQALLDLEALKESLTRLEQEYRGTSSPEGQSQA